MSRFRPPTPRLWVALSAGVLWALAFPLFNLSLAAWLAPGLLLLTGFGVDYRAALRLGYFAGVAHHLIGLYWLLYIPIAVGNVLAWLALSAYCALFPALWLWLCARARPTSSKPVPKPADRREAPLPFGNGPIKFRGATWEALRELLEAGWLRRQAWLLYAAAAWTGLEFLRGWFLSGFPWNFLAASQSKLVPLLQVASVTGVHGVTFLIVWVSLALAVAAVAVIIRPHHRFAWKNELAPALIALLLIITWGVSRTTAPPVNTDRSLRVALVQPSIPQTLIFDPAESTNRFNQLLELSRAALATKPDLLLWPEASLPLVDRAAFEQLRALLRASGTPIIFGSDDAQRIPDRDPERYRYYNAAFHFDGAGEFQAVYRKQRLVIFGEYTPGARWIPFLARWLPAGEGFANGDGPVPFRLAPSAANVAVNICFEDNFGDLVRAQVEPDTDFVLNLTNNGWFGESAAQWQHAANAIFRAIENAVPLVRCTNNGLTCWIDEFGRLREVFADEQGSVYGSGVSVFRIPLLSTGTLRSPTIYHRFGDWFGWFCLLTTGLPCLRWIRRKSR